MRKHYLDNIRWITVVLVVIYHVVYMYNGVATDGVIGAFHDNQPQDALLYLLNAWFMMILFIVSGISTRLSLSHSTDKEFLKKRTRKLLVPSTIGIFVLGWLQGYVSMEISNAFENLSAVPKLVLYIIMSLSGIGVLWYIQVLWVLSIILLLIRKVTKKKEKLFEKTTGTTLWMLLLFTIVVYIFCQILNTPVIVVYRFGRYGISFFMGYYVFAHEEVIDRLAKWCIPLSISAIVSGIAYTVIYWGENYATDPVANSVLNVIYSWLSCLAVLGIAKKYLNTTNKFTEFMSKKSFGLYVFHYFPLSLVAYLLDRYTNTPAIACYLITGIVSFAGGYIIYEIVSRIPFIRWCVLGIKKEKEKNNV